MSPTPLCYEVSFWVGLKKVPPLAGKAVGGTALKVDVAEERGGLWLR